MKNILSYKKEAVYLCKSKEEQMMLADYMVQICGFKPISDLNIHLHLNIIMKL